MAPHTDIDVMIIVERSDGSVLLAERFGPGRRAAQRWEQPRGVCGLPGGTTRPGESVVEAAAREALAHTGIAVDPSALRLVHVMQHRDDDGRCRVGWFLAVARWGGEPACSGPGPDTGLAWHRADRLPEHTLPYHALGIAHYLKGEPFSVHGW